MKTTKKTLSPFARSAKFYQTEKGQINYAKISFASNVLFSIAWLIIGIIGEQTYHFVFSVAFGILSIWWLVKIVRIKKSQHEDYKK